MAKVIVRLTSEKAINDFKRIQVALQDKVTAARESLKDTLDLLRNE